MGDLFTDDGHDGDRAHERRMAELEPNRLLERAVTALNGLLKIAELAMPDSYLASDRRVKRAKALIKDIKKLRPKS